MTAATPTGAAVAAQVRAELLKLVSVRANLAVAAGLVALEILFKVISTVLLDPARATRAEVIYALKPSITYPVLAASLGILLASAEWRYGTAGPTYSVQPRRGVVLAAKAIVAAGAGLLVGLLATVLASAAALVVAGRRALPALGAGEVIEIGAGAILAAAGLAALGAALGTLVRSQVAAFAVAVAVLFVLAPLAILIDPAVYAWTPGGAADALAAQQAPNPALLAQPAGAALLLAYVIALLGWAGVAVGRQDVQ